MINQCICNSFRQEVFEAVHNFASVGGDVFKIALYDNTAQLGATTTVYTAVGEVVATGYTTTGQVLNGQTVVVTQPQTGPQTYITFDNASWTADIVARGALIYNSSKGNKAVMVLDFGLDVSSTDGVFTVQMPVAGPNTALLCFT